MGMAKNVPKTKIRKDRSNPSNYRSLIAEFVDPESLKTHPRNYRRHGDDQLEHIIASIRENGFYKNVVVSKDRTILAGHGAVEAAKKLGLLQIPVVRLPIDLNDPQALKILTGDNEISKLADVDDRVLTDILKELATVNLDDLLGTGFNGDQLANLIFVTRPETEIQTFDAAREWVGLPEYQERDETTDVELVIEVTFKSAADRESFIKEKDLKIRDRRGGRKWSTVWPFVERNDLKSVKFEVSDIK